MEVLTDVYCFICGNPAQPSYDHEITNYMEYNTLLTTSGDTIHNCLLLATGKTVFTTNIKMRDYYLPGLKCFPKMINEGMLYKCMFVHDDCYKFVQQKYNVSLSYSMFTIKKGAKDQLGLIDDITVNYRTQKSKDNKYFYDFNKIFADGNDYILHSPLHYNKANLLRINKLIKHNFGKLFSKIVNKRTGPNIPASLEKEKTIRMGNDGNFWIKKGAKWVKLPIKPIKKIITYDKNSVDKLLKIAQICEPSKKMLFMKLMDNQQVCLYGGDENSINKFKLI